VVNYWWQGFPANLLREAYNRELAQDQWALRVAHYIPWLTYWWNTQKWFPGASSVVGNINTLSPHDFQVLSKIVGTKMCKVLQLSLLIYIGKRVKMSFSNNPKSSLKPLKWSLLTINDDFLSSCTKVVIDTLSLKMPPKSQCGYYYHNMNYKAKN
jgi:hypothetical protein